MINNNAITHWKSLPTTLLLLCLSHLSYACICIELGTNFFDTVHQHNTKVEQGEYPPTDALTIFTGQVKEYELTTPGIIPKAMFIEVSDLIQGESIPKLIRVEGDTDGSQCRPPVIQFSINSSYIIAANQDETGQFYLSGCGHYYLKIHKI